MAIATAHGSLGELPLEFRGRAGPLKHLIIGGGMELKIDLSLGEIDFNLAGDVADSLTGKGADVTINFSGPDIGWVTQQFALPEFTQGPFDLDLKLDTGEYDTELNLVGDLGHLDVNASGKVDDFRRPREGHLKFEITGPDLQSLGEALGEPKLVSAPYHFKGDVSAHLGVVEIHTFQFEVGENTGQIVGKIGEWPALTDTEIHLYISGPDLSQWGPVLHIEGLSVQAFSYTGHLANTDSDLLLTSNRLEAGDSYIEVAGSLGRPPKFLGSSLDVDLYFPDLSKVTVLPGHGALPAEPLTVQGGVARKGQMLWLNNMRVALGGNTLSFNGQVALPDPQTPDKLFANVQLAVPSLRKIPFYPGAQKLPDLPGRVNGHLEYRDKLLRLANVTGSAANSKFKFDALLTFEEKFAGSHIEFEISGPDFRPLLAIDALAPLPGKFRASGRVEKGAGADQLKGLELDLGNMRARVNGTVDDLTRLGSADLSVSVNLPSLSELDGVLDQEFPDLPFSMEISFSGNGSRFTLDPLKANLGPSKLSGIISVDLKEDPVIEGRLSSDFLDLAWLTASDEGKKVAAKTDGRVFPDAPIPYAEYGRAKIDLDLSVDRLKLDYTELNRLAVDLSLSKDYFRVNSFEFGGPLGETLSGRLAVSGSEAETQLEFEMEGDELRLGIAAAEDQDVSTYPPTSISMDIRGKGATWRQLASSLDGRIRIVQGKGLIANAGLELLFSDLMSELFNTLNPFAEKSVYTGLECAVLNAVIDSGKVLVDPIIFHTEQVTILSGGQIDLATEKIDLEFQTKVRKGIGISAGMVINPFIKLGGTLATPTIELDPAGVAFSGSVAVATVGLSLVGKSLFDRYLSSKDPCGEALERLDKAEKRP